MRVQVVRDENPARLRIRRNDPLNVPRKILLRPGRIQQRRDDSAASDVPISEQACRPVTLVFIFDSLRFSWLHRLVRSDSFQGLNAGLFIRRNRVDSFSFVISRVQVRLTDFFNLPFVLFRILDLRIEPIPALVRRQVVFLIFATPSMPKSSRRYRDGRLHRRGVRASNA